MSFLDRLTALPESKKFTNGVRTFFRKTLPSGLVSIQVWIKTGSVHEGEFLGSGISHYLEHMVFKGTEKFSAEEITQRIQAVGGNINAYTSYTRTVYHIDVPVEAAETAFEILAQLTQKPRLDSVDAAREKDVILREIAMSDDDPDSRLAEATLAETFRVHPYRLPIIGFKDVFSNISDQELRTYFEKRYTPTNTNVVVAGDLDAETVFELSEKYFSAMPSKPVPAPFIPAEPPQLAPREITLRGNVKVLRGNLLWKIPGIAHADTPALSVLAALLGKGDSSLLWQELHEKLGLVHALDVSAWAPNDIGLFWISYTANLGDRKKIESTLLKGVEHIAKNGVAKTLLKKVSRQAMTSLINTLASTSSTAERLGVECVEYSDPAATKIFLEKINALSSEQIQAVAKKYLHSETQTTSAYEQVESQKTKSQRAQTPASTSTLPLFEETTLACGIRVLLQPVSGFPKVHIRASMLGGGAFESEKTKGASALLSTLMTLDAGTLNSAEVAEKIESVGGRFDEISGNNTLTLFAETLSGDEKIGSEILANALCAARFPKASFSRERSSQIADIKSDYDDVDEFARIELRKEFFGEHPLAIHNCGTEKSLAKLKLDDIKTLHSRLVVPENIVIAASGEFDRDRLLATLEKHFSKMRFPSPKTSENFSAAFKTFSPKKAREIEIVSPTAAEQAIVQLAFPDVGFCDERYWVGTLADELLSGMSSRLFLEVREKRGLAYFIGANRVGAPEAGMFYLCAGTEKTKTQTVLEEMHKEIQRLRDGKIPAEELAGAKTRICVAQRSARQKSASRCGNATLNALYRQPVNREAEMEARIRALTVDDIARFATEILSPDFALALTVK